MNISSGSITIIGQLNCHKHVSPKIDLESYKDEISALCQQQSTTDTICAHLKQRHSSDIGNCSTPLPWPINIPAK